MNNVLNMNFEIKIVIFYDFKTLVKSTPVIGHPQMITYNF